MGSVISKLVAFFKNEPAVVLGGIAAALLVTQDAAIENGVNDWDSLVPVVVSLVIRQFVVPAPPK